MEQDSDHFQLIIPSMLTQESKVVRADRDAQGTRSFDRMLSVFWCKFLFMGYMAGSLMLCVQFQTPVKEISVVQIARQNLLLSASQTPGLTIIICTLVCVNLWWCSSSSI